MSNYLIKMAAYNRLMKIASAAAVVRRRRALQKYAYLMQKQALGTGAISAIGSGVGAGVGAGAGYLLGKKDKKLLSTLIGAGSGAGVGALGGWGLGALINHKKETPGTDEALTAASKGKTFTDFNDKDIERTARAAGMKPGTPEYDGYVAYAKEQQHKNQIKQDYADADAMQLANALSDIQAMHQNKNLTNSMLEQVASMYGVDPLKLKAEFAKANGGQYFIPENY